MLDNSIISVISTIMICLGFMNGYIVAYGLSLEKILKLNKKLQEAIDQKFELDKEVDELNEKYNKLLEKYSYYSTLICNISNNLKQTDLYDDLPPLPVSPLVRCNSPCYENEDDDELSRFSDSSNTD